MAWYIAFKDIAAFFRSEKKVFIMLLLFMISGSFVLNYSYSFARYRGEIYEHSSGARTERYKIRGISPTASAKMILEQISDGDFGGVKDYQLFGRSDDGAAVVGSSFISEHSSAFTGNWTEGYYSDINNTGDPVCAVNGKLLDYGGRLKMVGETLTLDGEDFIIKGVFEPWLNDTDIVIFADKFTQKYDELDEMWITFEQRLSDTQRAQLEKIIKETVPHAGITYPPAPGETGADIVKSNQLQYTAVIIMLVVCLASLIRYWQSVNLSAYTIYWLGGAANSQIMKAAACEALILCTVTYFAGLGLNAVSRNLFSRNSPLTINDVLVGFAIFFGTFALFTLINTSKICREFKVTDVRRD